MLMMLRRKKPAKASLASSDVGSSGFLCQIKRNEGEILRKELKFIRGLRCSQ